MVQDKICRGVDIYVFISIRICMYIALQPVRCPISRQQALGSWFVG